MAQQLELRMISSTWLDTKIGLEEGIRKAKEIGLTPTTSSRTPDAEPEISGRTTLRTMTLVEAAYRSGRAVPLSETMPETVAP